MIIWFFHLVFFYLLVNNQLLWGSSINNFTMQAEGYEQKLNYEWPSSSEINLPKFNGF